MDSIVKITESFSKYFPVFDQKNKIGIIIHNDFEEDILKGIYGVLKNNE